jgi:S1-C subfamily serine protease
MQVGDVIVAVNGREVESSAQVRNEIGLLRIGSRVKIEMLRNGEPHILMATVQEQVTNSISGEELSQKLTGAEFSEISEEASRGVTAGIEVVSVKGYAATAGLQKGDIIISLNKKRVKTIQDMQAAIKKNPNALLLNIQRGARGLFVLIQ